MLIQDVELEHARNIIRMMIRNERKRAEALLAAYEGILEGMAADDDFLNEATLDGETNNSHTLH